MGKGKGMIGAPDHPKSIGKSMGGGSLTKFGKTMDNRATVIGKGIKGPSATVYGSAVNRNENVYGSSNEVRQ